MKELFAHKLSVELYQAAKKEKLPHYLKDQLMRASSSVALNLNEGWGRRTEKDRMKFFTIALGSLREVQSIIKLENLVALEAKADFIGICIYKLTKSAQK